MGATNIHYEIARLDRSPRKCYEDLVEEARYEYGNNCYSGTIATTNGFFMVDKPEDDDKYEQVLNSCDKWGKCACWIDGDRYVFIGWAAI